MAFKAETNFVDVIPLAKKMRLSLNMRFSEINDPKGLCRDITGLGKCLVDSTPNGRGNCISGLCS